MTQTSNRLFDEFAKLMTDAAGVAQGVRREAETAFKAQAEKFLSDLDLVKREEFDVVRELAIKAREENESLKARISALEDRIAHIQTPPTAPDSGEATQFAGGSI
jgi:BMFP domain-containing protein YqiC